MRMNGLNMHNTVNAFTSSNPFEWLGSASAGSPKSSGGFMFQNSKLNAEAAIFEFGGSPGPAVGALPTSLYHNVSLLLS